MVNLLIHIFIILLPTYILQIYMILNYKKPSLTIPPYIYLIAFGLSGMLSEWLQIWLNGTALFPWGLRAIPMVISYCYGGTTVGIGVTVWMGATRLLIGGDAVWLDLLGYVLFGLFLSVYWRFYPKQKLKPIMISATIQVLVFFIILGLFQIVNVLKGSSTDVLEGYTVWEYIGLVGLSALLINILIILVKHIKESYEYRHKVVESERLQIFSDMAASVAHEVRNPLMVTRGFLQLADKRSDELTKSYLQTALSELDRAADIITDYLTFAKPHHDASTILIHLHTELLRSIQSMIPYANLHGLQIRSELEPGLYVQGDPQKLKQIMMNLLKNAIEASLGCLDIKIRLFRDNNDAVIQVLDKGQGMTEEELQRLGSPFYTTKTKGTGLGLMVTFKLVETFQGELRFYSKKGEGTTAVLRIPLHPKSFDATG